MENDDKNKSTVLLIYPYHKALMIAPPLGLGYLASSLLAAGHEVEILDCARDGIRSEDLGRVLSGKDPDIIGITAMTPFYPAVIETCKVVRKFCSRAKIVLGGPHPTALPELTLRETGADAIIMGEGEKTITEIADSRGSWEKIRGIAYLDGDKKMVQTGTRPLVSNLDKLSWPAWDMIAPDKYPKSPHGFFVRNFPIAPVITSRGCPYNCSFCASNGIWQRKFRRRSPKDVVDEMEYLVKKFGVREIHLEDDNFTLVKKHALAVCMEMIDRKLNLSWACPNGVRADTLDFKLLQAMKKSGCYLLAFGIESGSERILDRHSKTIDKGNIRRAVRMCTEVGIETLGFFIFGLPGETKETIRKTIDFSKELELDRAYFFTFTPTPGSRLWNEMKPETLDWGRFDFRKVNFPFSGLPESELKRARLRAFLEFYVRPKILMKLLKYLKLSQLGMLLEKVKKEVS